MCFFICDVSNPNGLAIKDYTFFFIAQVPLKATQFSIAFMDFAYVSSSASLEKTIFTNEVADQAQLVHSEKFNY